MNRIDSLKRKAFEDKGFNGFLVTNEVNIFYFTKFAATPGTACLLIPDEGKSSVFVYGVNYEQAKQEAVGITVERAERGENLMMKAASKVKDRKIDRLAFDTMNHEAYRLLAKELRGRAKIKSQGSLVWDLRKVKDEEELGLMRKAGEITSAAMAAACEAIKPGVKEIEVAAEIEYTMRRKGGWGTAFETSVASGLHSAFPHGGCTDRKIRDGDLVVVDIGAKYQHYCSDMTRTFVAGKPSAKQKKLFEIVRTAQEKAFQAIKHKANGKDVDTAARKVIEEAGYGNSFVHGLGHGVGLEIHEPPGLGQASKDRLAIGNVVTDEPGIYIIGFGGVRIEDSVFVQKQPERITYGSEELELKT